MINGSEILQSISAAHQITTQNNTATMHQHVPTVPAILSITDLLPGPCAILWKI